jgi:polyhydroxyalkanoate synthesis regulator protein
LEAVGVAESVLQQVILKIEEEGKALLCLAILLQFLEILTMF